MSMLHTLAEVVANICVYQYNLLLYIHITEYLNVFSGMKVNSLGEDLMDVVYLFDVMEWNMKESLKMEK